MLLIFFVLHVREMNNKSTLPSGCGRPWRWRQQVPPKDYYPLASLYDVTTKNTTTWMLKTAKASDLTSLNSPVWTPTSACVLRWRTWLSQKHELHRRSYFLAPWLLSLSLFCRSYCLDVCVCMRKRERVRVCIIGYLRLFQSYFEKPDSHSAGQWISHIL
jgi:hypothetical protein